MLDYSGILRSRVRVAVHRRDHLRSTFPAVVAAWDLIHELQQICLF
jgi:hypothetical protein